MARRPVDADTMTGRLYHRVTNDFFALCPFFITPLYTHLTSIKAYGATYRGCDAIICRVGLKIIFRGLFHDLLAAPDINASLSLCDPASADVIDICFAIGIQNYAIYADIFELDEVVGLDARCARDGQVCTM